MPARLLDRLLRDFPSHTHALTLVSDPDDLLGHPELQAALAERGFRLLPANDPIALRQAWDAAQPVTVQQPLLVVTPAALNTLPYDLWQQGQRAELGLASLLPRLDATLLAGLTLAQLDRVWQATSDEPATGKQAASLGRTGSLDAILLHGFGAAPHQLAQPGPLLRWLAELHGSGETLPQPLRLALAARLAPQPALAGWPLADLLSDRAAFAAFAQAQWHAYVRSLAEQTVGYASLIPFASDGATQTAIAALVSHGLLQPVAVAEPAALPGWSQQGVRADSELRRRLRWEAAADAVVQALHPPPATWPQWQQVAQHWARLTVARYAGDTATPPAETGLYQSLASDLDLRFARWLATNYGRLASRALPTPHHLYHIPQVLAQGAAGGKRVALVVVDGMSLATWQVIWATWTPRHPNWRASETLVLAQVPTITAISRQALLAGRPPRDFAASLTNNAQEEAHWRRFWRARDLPDQAIAYASIPDQVDRPYPAALDSLHTRALAVILRDIDALVHGATSGLAGVYAGLNAWLNSNAGSLWLETLIAALLAHEYRVWITSDHGHVEALGIGQPREGVSVITRSKRARIYDSEVLAGGVHQGFLGTTRLWHGDGLLPADRWVLMPLGTGAFTTLGQQVVSHGAITIDEMVVPLIEIERTNG